MDEYETFRDAATRLREERGWTQTDLIREVGNLKIEGARDSKVQQSLQGATPPNLPVMSAVAEVLGVDPTAFLEYRLMLARYALDERVVGPEFAAGLLAGSPLLNPEAYLPATRLAIEKAARAAARSRGKPNASPGNPGAAGDKGAAA